MSPKQDDSGWTEPKATALLVLADGTVLEGFGLGATGHAVGEVCFNTAMTGYEEILTDPSYAGQIITFTFPHIGNVGTNEEDIETVNMAATPGARGVILRTAITEPSNYRATRHLDQWLKARGIIGLSGIDTRALTALIREKGMPNAVIAHEPTGKFDLDALKKEAREWPGLVGMDLVPMVTSGQRFTWDETPWEWGKGYGRQTEPEFHVVAIDYGIKRNILRLLASDGCKVTVVPATTSAEDILALKPDGVFLSNGPGDPAATGEYAVPVIRKLIDSGMPTFGICLGHQMLGIAVGGQTMKMHQGHHGANHPVKDLTTGKVEITSMNHGFAVDKDSLPENVEQTHVSLFDGSNCGIALKDRPVFSVQYHPEASPGPRDSHYLFARFVETDAGAQAVGDDCRPTPGRIGRETLRQFLTQDRCRPPVPLDAHHQAVRARDLSVRRRRLGAQQPAPAVPGLSRRHRSDRHARSRGRDREDVPRQRLGRHVAQRHLSLRALSFHDPRRLGIARGRAKVRFGGSNGGEIEFAPGDVAVLPAGTGHQCLWSSPDLLVIGAYPPSGRYDLCRGSKAEHAKALETIPRVPLPDMDPVFGKEGPLLRLWHN